MLHFHDVYTAAVNPQGYLRMLEQEQRERERHFKPAEMRAAEYPQPAPRETAPKTSWWLRLRRRLSGVAKPAPRGCPAA